MKRLNLLNPGRGQTMPDVLAIDPGTEESAYLVYDVAKKEVWEMDILPNQELLEKIRGEFQDYHTLPMAIEKIESQGMAPSGASTFTTCLWIGRFVEAWDFRGHPFTLCSRREIKLCLCGQSRAKDPNIRQALIDLHGGDLRAIGGKKCPNCKGKGWRGAGRLVCTECNGGKWKYPPGPLHRVSTHLWSALAGAVYWSKAKDMEE